jgi:DNA polymerase-3 subunit gamma/tau
MGPSGATRALEVLGEAFVGIQDAPDPRITLEVALVRLTRPDAELSLSALADRIARLERGQPPAVASGSAPAAQPTEGGDAPRGAAPSSSPGSSAREALAQSKPPAGARPATKQAARAPKAPPAKRAARKAAPAEPPQARQADAATSAAPPAAPAGELPTRDELVMAWGDSVLPSLPARAKSRFAPGRFLRVDPDAVVFGLPNKIHAAKCEEIRPDVEAALAAHFGRATPLRIVVDEGATPPPERGAPAPPATDLADEVVDLTELTDAPDAPATGVDVVNQIFPGAEVVEGD